MRSGRERAEGGKQDRMCVRACVRVCVCVCVCVTFMCWLTLAKSKAYL